MITCLLDDSDLDALLLLLLGFGLNLGVNEPLPNDDLRRLIQGQLKLGVDEALVLKLVVICCF